MNQLCNAIHAVIIILALANHDRCFAADAIIYCPIYINIIYSRFVFLKYMMMSCTPLATTSSDSPRLHATIMHADIVKGTRGILIHVHTGIACIADMHLFFPITMPSHQTY